MTRRVMLVALCGLLASGETAASPTSPLESTPPKPGGEECARLERYRRAVLDEGTVHAARTATLEQLRWVPPVAWVEGYWATPVDLSRLETGSSPGKEWDDEAPQKPEVSEEQGLPPVGVAFTAADLRQAIVLPFVGELPRLDSVAAERRGVFLVPVTDPKAALYEYLPPATGADAPCYYFCGDPATWDFDSDGEPNTADPDDDDDGAEDSRDAYPYWPQASECDCGARAFVGFTSKFSARVTREVLRAYDTLSGPNEPVPLGSSSANGTGVWLVLPPCPAAASDCPEPDDVGVRFFGRDPGECARIRFRCDPGWAPFSNECGCGCELDE